MLEFFTILSVPGDYSKLLLSFIGMVWFLDNWRWFLDNIFLFGDSKKSIEHNPRTRSYSSFAMASGYNEEQLRYLNTFLKQVMLKSQSWYILQTVWKKTMLLSVVHRLIWCIGELHTCRPAVEMDCSSIEFSRSPSMWGCTRTPMMNILMLLVSHCTIGRTRMTRIQISSHEIFWMTGPVSL